MPEEQTGRVSEEIRGAEGKGVKKRGSQDKEGDFTVSESSHIPPG